MQPDYRDFRKGGFGLSLTVWSIAGALMLVPIVMLRGFEAAAWDVPGDLMFLAILLTVFGITYELAVRVPNRRAYQAAAAVAVAAALLGAWINLAVGIIGSEDNPANWIFAVPIIIAGFGAALARFRAAGMSKAMTAAAAAQCFVFFAALLAGLGFTGPITVFFAALWLISAWLFRRAKQGH